MLAVPLLAILHVGAVAGAPDCRKEALPREGAAWAVESECPAGSARPGDRLIIAPRGWVVLVEEEAERTCVNLGGAPVELSLPRASEPLGVLAGLRCGEPRPTSSDLEAGAPGLSAPARSVFVLPFEHGSVDEAGALVVVDAMTARLAGHRRLDVMSQADLSALLELEATRESVGCRESESCLAELAGALGARFVVTGSVVEREDLLHLQATLLDTEGARVVDRFAVDGRSVEELARRGQLLGENLARAAVGEEPEAIPPLDRGRRLGDAATMGTAALVGAIPFAAGLVFAGLPAVAAVAMVGGASALGSDTGAGGALVLGAFLGAGLAAALSLVVLPLAAPIASALLDRADDVEISWARAVTVSLAAGSVAVLGNLAALVGAVVGTLIAQTSPLAALAGTGPAALVGLIGGGAAALVVTTAVAGAGVGAVYYFGVALFGDTPVLEADEEVE